MQFSYSFSASAEDIFETVTDPQFLVDRCTALGSLEANCESDGEPLPKVTVQRTEAAELPPIMKKIVGAEQKMETVEQWSETEESYDSHSLTSIAGTPIKIEVAQCLYNTENGSEVSVEMTVTAKIPLLGSKVEPMVASKVRKEMLREFAYIDQSLSA